MRKNETHAGKESVSVILPSLLYSNFFEPKAKQKCFKNLRTLLFRIRPINLQWKPKLHTPVFEKTLKKRSCFSIRICMSAFCSGRFRPYLPPIWIEFWRFLWYIRLWRIVCNWYSWGSWNGTQSWRFKTDHEWYFCRNQDGLDSARSNVARQVNSELLNTYWNIGRIISEHEQTVPTTESRRWKSWLSSACCKEQTEEQTEVTGCTKTKR